MGSDLHMLSRDIAITSHPRLCALLRRIQQELRNEYWTDWDDVIAEIDRELTNASIQ